MLRIPLTQAIAQHVYASTPDLRIRNTLAGVDFLMMLEWSNAYLYRLGASLIRRCG